MGAQEGVAMGHCVRFVCLLVKVCICVCMHEFRARTNVIYE